MSQVIDQTSPEATAETDLVAAVHQVLQASGEPLTLSKIRSLLPGRFRGIELDDLAETLRRQVAANVLYQYVRYRSQQDRFWDRPMPVHISTLLRATLEESPLTWSELRRKLPAYAQLQAETVLREQLAQGTLYRHPRGGRGGDRFGVRPADPRDYLRQELLELFARLEQLGFSRAQLREAANEQLHDEEWTSAPPTAEAAPTAEVTTAPEHSPPAAAAATPGGAEQRPAEAAPARPETVPAEQQQPDLTKSPNPGIHMF